MNWITTEVEARYKETDQMGVVHHSNYIVWFELGRTNHIRQLGFSYAEMEQTGVLLPVIHVNTNYKKPIRYGEIATIRTKLKKYDGLRVIYAYEVVAPNGDLAVYGETEHVFLNKEKFKPMTIRKSYPKWHNAFLKMVEKGE